MNLKDELELIQNYPLWMKVEKTKLRIKEWYEHYDGEVYVSFSGGKDSTVLLHLVRELYPDVEAVFVDTGLEYPEVRKFVKTFDNVTILKPEMNFRKVIETEGYPIISKRVSRMLRDLKNPTESNANSRHLYLTGIKMDGTPTKQFKLPKKYIPLIDCDFKVSERCCDIMKKKPFKKYQKITHKKPFIGSMADEGGNRASVYWQTGCNSFKNGKSQPIGFWREQDILEFIHTNNIPIASIYGDIVLENGIYKTTQERRTGCVFCAFGANLEKHPNRFERLKITHPELYNYCLNKLGFKKVLDTIKVKY